MNQALWARCRSALKHGMMHALGVVRVLDRGASNAVLLTFDDGPHPEVTVGVLERLRAFNARAVFFVVGNRIVRAPALLARIRDEGHLIGNHSHEHWLGRAPWLRRYTRDLRQCQERIQSLTGEAPKLFRPPLGRVSLVSWAASRAVGLTTIHWTLDSGDWKLRRKEDAVARAEQLSPMVAPRDIILFHDNNECVLTILDILLPRLAAQGLDLQSAVTTVCPLRRLSD